jgi:hypothetical protein
MFIDSNPGLLFAKFLTLLGYAVCVWFVAGVVIQGGV